MHVEKAGSISEIPPAQWNEMARGGGLFTSHEYLGMARGSAWYLTVVSDGDYVAALPVYSLPPAENRYYQPTLHFPRLAGDGPSVLAGSQGGYRNQLIVHDGLVPADRQHAIRLLLASLRELTCQRGQDHAYFLFLTAGSAAELSRACPRARPELAYVGDTWITIEGSGFDDYLGALSRDRRQMVRREIRRFAEAGLTITAEDPVSLLPETARLMAQLEHKHGSETSEQEIASVLGDHYRALGPGAVTFACWLDGKPVGVSVGFAWGDKLYMRSAGFDYQALPGKFEYFNLVLYEPVRYCLRNGLRAVHLGATAHEAKVMRGARLSPLFNLALPAAEASRQETAAAGDGSIAYWAQQRARLPHGFDAATWSRVLTASGVHE